MAIRGTDTDRAAKRTPAQRTRNVAATPATAATASGNSHESPVPCDDVDRAMLDDEAMMLDIEAAEQAHAKARRGKKVDWDAVIDEHIL